MNIYLTHPITGLTYDEVMEYYGPITEQLRSYGFNVFTPMLGKDMLQVERSSAMSAEGYDYNPITTGHAIFQRDKWMVHQCDVLYANLLGAQKVSIGSMMELAWASVLQKYVVLVMEEDSIHRHAFVTEAADAWFADEEKAVNYLKRLGDQNGSK